MRKQQTLVIGTLLVVVFLGQGCATLVRGTTQRITITTDPSGAMATVAGNRVLTPATVELSRKHDATIFVEKEGYVPQQITLKRSIEPWTAGNLLLGGLPGLVVDAISGAMVKFNQDEVSFKLQPVGHADMSPGETAWNPKTKRYEPAAGTEVP